ncbi:MAG: Xaa-Pro aminopeptidase [Gammaproteobacteria bacterium]|nr:Xaa-Pro aminopeptidase [Gammaproteobacteria bacterium]
MLTKSMIAELKRRRRALMRQMGDHSIALIPAAREKVRSRDTFYHYRQDSNFYYLSGFEEPNSLLVLVPGRKSGEYLLFCREKDPDQEIWHGRRLGVDAAPEALGADDAFPINDVDDILPGLLEGRRHVYHTLGKDQEFDTQLLGWLQKSRASRRRDDDPDAFISIDYLLHDMRVYKSRSELARLRKAAKITASGLCSAMQSCKPGLHEYELEACLIGEYRRQNCQHAFAPIVGGGANGCILHYTENQSVLADGDLVLIDTGAEYLGYAGDISRTFPVNGEFSDAQRDIYSIVLKAQLAAIEQVCAGNHWRDPHNAAVRVITQGLKDIGILKGNLNSLIKKEAYRDYYMHGTGHWLGQDVHDVGETKIDGEWRLLEPNMVMTVEPGLYLGNHRRIPKRYRNIGIRIEDDVVVNDDGCEILSADVPKSMEDIESLMGS